jgi:hypothetical protein
MIKTINAPNTVAVRRCRKQEHGSILIMVALVALVLMVFMGLAFDASYMYYYKRRAQTAADAGAIAGAQELLRNTPGEVTTAARKDTQLNQFTHGVNGVNVAVNRPPLSGPRAGNSGFVEVIVSDPRPAWFMRVLGINSAVVSARAVAGLGDSQGCVYTLNRNTGNNDGIFVNGNANAKFSCAVYSNSNIRLVGSGCMETPSASYSGQYDNSSPGCGPAEAGHGVPVVDPMASRYTLPAISPCNFTNYKVTNGPNVTLTPGVYCGGIDISGISMATFSPGTYVLVGTSNSKGGLKLSASATGNGVTFFNTFATDPSQYNPIQITGGANNVNFSAPTSGANKALLFWQDPRVTWATNNGSSLTASTTSSFEGILYFPTTNLEYGGNSSSSSPTGGYTILVSYNLSVRGGSQVNNDFSALGGLSPIQVAAFTE